MKEMTARYAGTCCVTGKQIKPGDPIRYHGKGRSELISRTIMDWGADFNDDGTITDAVTGTLLTDDHPLDPPLPTRRKWVSSYFRSLDGREYYQNHKGRCEDAPCCGCCS